MLRRLTGSMTRRSTDSAAENSRSSVQTSRSSAQTPSSPIYSHPYDSQTPRTPAQSPHNSVQAPRYSDQAPRFSDQAPRFSIQTPRSSVGAPRSSGSAPLSAHTPRSSAQTPHSPFQTPRSSAQTPHSSLQTPRSSEGAPLSPRRISCYAYLSPPPASPYDFAAWAAHDALLANCINNAKLLSRRARAAEIRYKAAEAALPFFRVHEAGVYEKTATMREIHSLVATLRELERKDPKWRKVWMPSSPLLKYPAWGSIYSYVMGVSEGEGWAPWDSLCELDGQLQDLLKRVEML